MKVGIPAMGDSGLKERVSSHFGRAPVFILIDPETSETEVITNVKRSERNIQPPEKLAEKGVQVMICSGLGPRAIKMFEQYGIEVFIGASGTVREALEKWKSGELQEASDKDACEEHRRQFP